MSFCIQLRISKPQKSLPECVNDYGCEKTFLHIPMKASYTLEMAVVLPLVAAFFVAMLFFFRVLQVQTQVQEALVYASRRTATEAGSTDSIPVLMASAEAYFRKELQQYTEYKQYVVERSGPATLFMSDFNGPKVTLRADYDIRIPVGFFYIKALHMTQCSASRKWTGDQDQWMDTDYVYITEHGTVYHSSRSCSYLDLSIRSVEYAEIGTLRNKSEHKYYGCSQCVAKNKIPEQVYITNYGENYHSSLSCSGLKRTVYLIPISAVGEKGACSKCGT